MVSNLHIQGRKMPQTISRQCNHPTLDTKGDEMIREWISVKDRLPAVSGKYLVAQVKSPRYTEVATAYYYPKMSNGFYIGGGIKSSGITHWMHLPEPPKDNSDA